MASTRMHGRRRDLRDCFKHLGINGVMRAIVAVRSKNLESDISANLDALAPNTSISSDASYFESYSSHTVEHTP